MQLADELGALLLVDHEAQVQVVCRLRHEMDALLLEHLERGREPRQERPDLAADQADRRAARNQPDVAERLQVRDQSLKDVLAGFPVRRVDRHRDVRLRCRHQVDRYAVVAEDRECPRQEADFMPHADAVHRHQRKTVTHADALDLRFDFLRDRRDHGAIELGVRGAANEQRNTERPQRRQAAWVQHRAPRRCEFLGLVVMQRHQQPRGRHHARVGREHAGNVRPHLETPRLQFGRHVGGRRVGAAAPQQHGLALRIAGDESLRQDHLAHSVQTFPERVVG